MHGAMLGAVIIAAAETMFTAGLPELWLFALRSEEHTSELQSQSTISYAVFCLKKKKKKKPKKIKKKKKRKLSIKMLCILSIKEFNVW